MLAELPAEDSGQAGEVDRERGSRVAGYLDEEGCVNIRIGKWRYEFYAYTDPHKAWCVMRHYGGKMVTFWMWKLVVVFARWPRLRA